MGNGVHLKQFIKTLFQKLPFCSKHIIEEVTIHTVENGSVQAEFLVSNAVTNVSGILNDILFFPLQN